MNAESPLILALDTTEVNRCEALITATKQSVGIYKLGLEFYLRNGQSGLLEIARIFPGIRIFLDLKLHDIPNTVAGAARAVAALEPEILTVHASGGTAMIDAAVKQLPKTMVAAVTLLTSLQDSDLAPFGKPDMKSTVVALAKMASDAGARAIVASPHELAALRAALPESIKIITPGIRFEGAASDDQSRTMTPHQARLAGADFLVVGRPITGAPDPADAAAAILASIS